ncbi:hypothetical protein [Arthrobacter sp. 24S4-2]|uniref:hypothetical protein n=1 Tax=Arthrobacter sp. 24S4-2 TaxID=2575374 RepID=UPI0015863188|nr:hypothetical protein [Arthrobacter sp. 24S4-2]
MDRKLHALVKLDVTSDVVRIDVRGSLSQETRPALVLVIRRIRLMGITSHIRVDLSQAAFVESAALVGLRNDLNAIDHGVSEAGASGGSGVSLDFLPRREDVAGDDARFSKTLEITGEFAASIDPSGSGPLAKYSDDELLAASDSIFGMLDDPAAVAGTELLARYDAIGMEMSRRERAKASPGDTPDSLVALPSEPAS